MCLVVKVFQEVSHLANCDMFSFKTKSCWSCQYVHDFNIQLGPYLDTGTVFIILAADQNIFKLQLGLYNEYGLKVHTLIYQTYSRNIRSDQINSLVHSEKKECTGELSNIKRPGRPRRTTVVDNRRIISFTTSSHEKNTLQEVGVSLSKSTIKRLHQSKYLYLVVPEWQEEKM